MKREAGDTQPLCGSDDLPVPRAGDPDSGHRGGDPTAGAEEPPVSDATAFRLRQGTTHDAQAFSAGSGGIALSNVLGFVQTPAILSWR